jgi:hypothetical protein
VSLSSPSVRSVLGAAAFALAGSSAAFVGTASAAAAASRPSVPHVWQRWEQTLTATAARANPYADVTLRVRYTGPGGRTFAAFGFWDGGTTFRLRAAFPAPGTWHWETECSDSADPGLHRRRGTVEVAPYRGANPLYRRGFLRVADSRRHLAWADGTPYLWIGDTAWAGPHRATDGEWDEYLADRGAKGFSLVQVGVAPAWSGPVDARGEKPFLDAGLNQWNPAYWQAFERKIERANARGLVVLVVGLMEPVRRYPASAQACLFARNLVARLHGNGVIFSPSFDSRPHPLAHEVGQAVRAATTVHLVTQHPGTGPKIAEPRFSLFFADQPYLDFHGVQSGHNGGDRAACARHAIDWPLHLYHLEPVRPVINVEAMYDAQGDRAWQAIDARSQGWRSWLSGALGYTYGAGDRPPKVPGGSGGIWWWVTDPERYDHWRKALQWESATQMTHLRDFLAALPWWELAPAHDLVHAQPPEITRRIVLARAPGRDLAVAYLPDNDALAVDLSGFTAALTARWFDPVRGRYTAHPEPIAPGGVRRLAAPAPGEWVLLLAGADGASPPRPPAP